MILLQVAATTTGRGTVAEAIMLRQLGRMSVAILDMHTAVGDARRAEQVTTMMRTQFAQIADRLPAVQGKDDPPASSTAVREVPDVVWRATDGLAAPGTGSPVPTRLNPVKNTAAAGPRDRDGRGRE